MKFKLLESPYLESGRETRQNFYFKVFLPSFVWLHPSDNGFHSQATAAEITFPRSK